MPQAQTYQSEFTGLEMDARLTAVAQLTAALEALTAVVAQKYVKPASGIPSTDMDADVQAALAKANTAVQSLADYYTKSEVDQLLAAINGMDYVDVSTLPTASASTMGKIYLVGPDGSGYYSYYYTSYNGSAYSWVGPLGTTEISLSNYATKAELNQLDQEVNGVTPPSYTVQQATFSDKTFLRPASARVACAVAAGAYNVEIKPNGTFSIVGMYFLDSDGNQITVQNKNGTNVTQLGSNTSVGSSPYTVPAGTAYLGFNADNKITDGTIDVILTNTAPAIEGMKDKVDALDEAIGTAATEEEYSISGSLDTGDEYQRIGEQAIVAPKGSIINMAVTGTMTASKIRVYYNVANPEHLVWSPTIGAAYSFVALEDITTIFFSSDCVSAGTISLAINVLTPGDGIWGGASRVSKSIGGKWCAIGDSLTAQGFYLPRVVWYLGITAIYNYGVGGRTMQVVPGTPDSGIARAEYLASIPNDAALITILAGGNDWAQSLPLGQVGDTSVNTYCGALAFCIDYIYEHYPTARLVILCPPFHTMTRFPASGGILNNNGHSMMDFANAVQAVCDAKACACVKAGQRAGWNEKNIATYVNNEDGNYIHLNPVGGDRMGRVIADDIAALL